LAALLIGIAASGGYSLISMPAKLKNGKQDPTLLSQ